MIVNRIIDDRLNERFSDMTSAFPYCQVTTDLTDTEYPWHWHEQLELGYVESGAMRILTPDREFQLSQGDIFFINSNTIHMAQHLKRNVKTVEVVNLFYEVFISGHFHSIFETKYMNPLILNQNLKTVVLKGDTPAGKCICDLLKKVNEIQNQEEPEFFIRNYLSEAWYYLYREICRMDFGSNSIQGSQERVRNMISFISEHYMEKVTLQDIADSVGIGVREANRCFKKNLGQSPMEYLLTYRLNTAQKALQGTEDSVTDIAYQNGFGDAAYFSRAFKKYFSMSPSEFREKYK